MEIHTFIIKSGVQGNSIFLLQTSKTHRIRCLLFWCLTLCLPTLRPQNHSYSQSPSSLSVGYLLPSWLTKRSPFSFFLSFSALIDHYTLTYNPQGGRPEPARATWLKSSWERAVIYSWALGLPWLSQDVSKPCVLPDSLPTPQPHTDSCSLASLSLLPKWTPNSSLASPTAPLPVLLHPVCDS